MNNDELQLELLLDRLMNCPEAFLYPPIAAGEKNAGGLHADALVCDLLIDAGGVLLSPEEAREFQKGKDKKERNRLSLIAVTVYLLADPLILARTNANALYKFLKSGLDELAALTVAEKFITDPDRREELVRRALAGLDLRLAGESPEQAKDRLAALDSVERFRVVMQSREKEKKRQKEAEEKRKREAAEALRQQEEANKVTRE